MRVAVLAFTFSVLAAGAALASPFDGAWSRDPARSREVGDVLTFAPAAGGMRYVSGPDNYVFTFGKEMKLAPIGWTVVWTKSPDGGLMSVTRINDRVATEVSYSLAPDGRSFTQAVVNHPVSGEDTHLSYTYNRLSGRSGFAGRWRSVAGEVGPAEVTFSTPAPGRQEIRFARSKSVYEGPVTGADRVSGPTVPPNGTATSRSISPRVREIRTYLSGKPLSVARWILSGDGKTLTETQYFVKDPTAVATYVYTRKE